MIDMQPQQNLFIKRTQKNEGTVKNLNLFFVEDLFRIYQVNLNLKRHRPQVFPNLINELTKC